MNLHFFKNSRNILLAPLAILAFAGDAHACSWDDITCQVNAIKDAANNQANQIIADANSYATSVAKQAVIDATNIVAFANHNADQIRTAAVLYVANSATIDTALYGDLVSQAVTAYSKSTSRIVNDYNTAIAQANAIENAAATLVFRNAGDAALNKDRATLLALNNQLTHLDKEGQATLNRLLRAIATGNLDDQSRKDMKSLAATLGLLVGVHNDYSHSYNVPSNVTKSNFSICLGGDGAYVGGAYASFCFAMDITPDAGGNHKMAIIENLGLTMGYGLGLGGSITWSPGTIAKNVGANIGFQGTVAPAVDVAMSWDIPTSHSAVFSLSAQDAIPSYTLGIGAGTPINDTINAGGTFLITTSL